MPTARSARPGDIPVIVTLARRARSEAAALRGGGLWGNREAVGEPLEEAYESLLRDGEARLVVAELGGGLAGFGAVEIDTLHDGGALGVIRDLYVAPQSRRCGLGTAMLTMLTAFCDERGCVGVDALALPGDRAAKNLFEVSSFKARALVMHHTRPARDA